MKRVVGVVLAAAIALLALTTQVLAAGPTQFLISGGPYEGTRSAGGAATLTISASNLTANEVEVALESEECSPAIATPPLEPFTTDDVTFTMACAAGDGPRDASVTARIINTSRTLNPARIGFQFTLTTEDAPSEWSALWWFLIAGIVMAAVSVIPPYLVWVRWPKGNASDALAAVDVAANQARPPDEPRIQTPPFAGFWQAVKDAWRPKLGMQLKGFASDWSFTDSWVTNVSLAAALFTGVFVTGADSLEGIVGTDATGKLRVIAVAAALCAGAVGTGPLWLTIFKRRYEVDNGVAKYNTVAGVLAASLVVQFGSIGLVATVARVLGLGAGWIAALLTVGLLVAYSWKSIPQMLALGANEEPVPGNAALQ